MTPVALVAAAALAAAPATTQAFPTFMLIRGGGLGEPVLLFHKNARSGLIHLGNDTTRPKVRIAVLYESPIFRFFSDRQQRSRILPEEYRDAVRSYEIAESWGWGADEAHMPHRPLRWEEATRYAMLHVRRDAPPLYVRSSTAYLPEASGGILSDTAAVILERWGIPMQAKGD